METNEHRDAGNKIRIMTLDNPYLQGSNGLSPDSENLRVRMMRIVEGIPVPLDVEVDAGDIVALAGDYFTKAGWGSGFTNPSNDRPRKKDNEALFNLAVSPEENGVFLDAYSDLASPTLSEDEIKKFMRLKKQPIFPFCHRLITFFNNWCMHLRSRITIKNYC
ncbi:hypothetical protein [Legionella tunisiensis]|uniref:hypothetical protein n=1 Tax=Legionella tunisiensis TaxID=1034944 RepID=UPI0002E59A62|nr:hypothetical protein [Legionella tunisiensis]